MIDIAEKPHALAGPSSSDRWTACTGSLALIKKGKYADKSGAAADYGTFLHGIADKALRAGKPAEAYLGESGTVGGGHYNVCARGVELVQAYLDTVAQYAGDDGVVYPEQELDISFLTGEEGAVGTADCIIVRGDELIVIDFKTGRIEVEAERNTQLAMYAAAALHALAEGKLTPPVTPVVDDLEDLL